MAKSCFLFIKSLIFCRMVKGHEAGPVPASLPCPFGYGSDTIMSALLAKLQFAQCDSS